MELHYGKEGFPLKHLSRTKSATEKPFPIKTKRKENTKQSLKNVSYLTATVFWLTAFIHENITAVYLWIKNS